MGRSADLTIGLCLATLVSCFTAPAWSQDQALSYDPETVLSQMPASGTFPLTLADAIAIGLVNNLDVEVERYAPLLAYHGKEAAWGAYDPNTFAEFGYASDETPTASSLQSGNSVTTRRTDGEGGVRGLVPALGAEYSLSLTGQIERTNQSIRSLSPELTSSLTLGGSIPLLKDLIWNEAWTNVKTSGILYESSREAFRTSVMDTVQKIRDAYWDLIASKEKRRVAETSLKTSQALLDPTQTQDEVGVVSKAEVVQAEAGVAARELDLIVASNDFDNAQDALIDVVLGPHLTAGSQLELLPTDDPEAYQRIEGAGRCEAGDRAQPDPAPLCQEPAPSPARRSAFLRIQGPGGGRKGAAELQRANCELGQPGRDCTDQHHRRLERYLARD
jgi:hypothetical protein